MLFFWLSVVAGILAFLIAVEACNLISIMLLPKNFFKGNDSIIASSRGFYLFPSAFS